MLKQRVITAAVLLIVLALVLAAPGDWPVPALLGLACACALWEWLRLVWPLQGARKSGPLALAVLFALFMAAAFLSSQYLPMTLDVGAADGATRVVGANTHQFFAQVSRFAVPLAALFWLLGATAMVVRGRTQAAPASWALAAAGIVVIYVAWWSLTALYLLHGARLLVSLMALVWAADIGAYAAGKTWGRRKLAPRVSPGKSVEGAIGGIVAALLWVWLTAYVPGGIGMRLAFDWPWPLIALIVIFLAAMSIVGDLFESLLKRRAGVKDSSNLLPGHGGVYDRIDALLPVSVLAWLLLMALPRWVKLPW